MTPFDREPKQEDAKDGKEQRKMKIVWEYVQIIIIATALALFFSKVLIINANIPSGSMEDTIHPGDRVIGFRLSYLGRDPQRKDIIIFRYPDNESQIFIKRVIGLPGDTVEVKDGQVYINDSEKPLKEPYIKEMIEGDFGPYKVPENSYFVLGDNRNNSRDSRYWEDQYVEKDEILAKAIFRYFPRITLLK